MISYKEHRGFTLIELLVVVAIIGLLSSVVLASLSTARLKARDATIRQELNQFRILVEQNFNETGTYSNLQGGWSCDNFQGPYATNAKAICDDIYKKSGDNPAAGNLHMHTGNQYDNSTRFALMAYLPEKQAWYCIGNSGSSDIMGTSGHTAYWNELGCYSNP